MARPKAHRRGHIKPRANAAMPHPTAPHPRSPLSSLVGKIKENTMSHHANRHNGGEETPAQCDPAQEPAIAQNNRLGANEFDLGIDTCTRPGSRKLCCTHNATSYSNIHRTAA